MIFNSLSFLIFFPVVTILYFLLPHKWRWVHLLVASSIFYMSFIPAYLLILFFLILVDYITGLAIYNTKTIYKKRLYLILSILSMLLVLFIFKYFNFVNINVAWLAQFIGWNYSYATLTLLLPIGLSFHTFQSLSYVIEVYRGKQKPEKHIGIYALYVMFYPQLVAGPIERPYHMLHQFHEKHSFNKDNFVFGLKRMLWGFFKKIVIADNLAVIVNLVYGNPSDFSGTALIIATFFFAFQIYCDFSGYCDIALGAAQIMGFRMMENFRRPYLARSIPDFWRRWHISLSTWFRDYVYISLGGSKVSIPRWYLNLFLVFMISGLWHGANWTFVIWGALHGVYMIVYVSYDSLMKRVPSVNSFLLRKEFRMLSVILSTMLTFILASFAWIFFRAQSLSDAWIIITRMFSGLSLDLASQGLGMGWLGLMFYLSLIGLLMFVQSLQEKNIDVYLTKKPVALQWLVFFTLGTTILLFGVFETTSFIYFQF